MPQGGRRAFTLTELLVVISIMALLMAISIPSLRGLGGAQQFTKGIGQISGILEQARSYAIAEDTYVWIAIYPYDPSTWTPPDNSGDALFVAAFASNDGTDPIGWTTTSAIPVPGTVSGTTTAISQIFRIANFRQIAIRTESYFAQGSGANQIASLPSGIDPSPIEPSATPLFKIEMKGMGASSLSLPIGSAPSDEPTSQPISVVQFTPSGAARASGSPVDSIWIDFQRVSAKGVLDNQNIAALQINGLTGLTTLYRK